MKKIISLILTICILSIMVTTVPITASAATDGIYYYTVTDGKATITDCDASASGAISIPATIGGYPVTAIGNNAFSWCNLLTNITIPDSVTSIGKRAFYECSSLTEITIPDNVTSIGERAFSRCKSLTEITIPDSVTSIEDKVFNDCRSLTEITIPDSVTSIGSSAFSSCSSLTEITIPDSVTSIGEQAFSDCYSLTDVYYTGSEEEWNKISISSGNDYLKNATIHYNHGSNQGGSDEWLQYDKESDSVVVHSPVDKTGVKLVAVLYDNEKVVDVKLTDIDIVPGKNIYANPFAGTNIGAIVKVYVWDTNLRPITNMIIFDVSNIEPDEPDVNKTLLYGTEYTELPTPEASLYR